MYLARGHATFFDTVVDNFIVSSFLGKSSGQLHDYFATSVDIFTTCLLGDTICI